MSLLERLNEAHRERRAKFFPVQPQLAPEEIVLCETKERIKKRQQEIKDEMKRLDDLEQQYALRMREFNALAPNFRMILEAVCKYCSISKRDIFSRRRRANLSRARQLVYYLSRHTTSLSFTEIGRIMKRDHTTIIHGVAKIERVMKTNSYLAQQIQELFAMLGQEPTE